MFKRLVTTSVLVIFASASYAQATNCDEGVIRLPDRSGTIQICSALAQQVPQLSRQLSEAIKTLGGQQAQIDKLSRLVQGLNAASQSIGQDRQKQMLQALSAELSRAQRQGDDRTRNSIETLSQQLDDLRAQLRESQSTKEAVEATKLGLNGEIGNSIARLEISSAIRQLDDIGTRVKELQGQVDSVKSDTQEIREALKAAQEREQKEKLEFQRMHEQAMREAEQNAREMQRQILADPKGFGFIMATGYGNYDIPNYEITVHLNRSPWLQAKLVVIGRPARSSHWFVDLSDFLERRQVNGSQSVKGPLFASSGDTTVCLTAFDTARKEMVTLYVTYPNQLNNERKRSAFFTPVPLHPEKLEPASPSVCGTHGLTQRTLRSKQ